MRALLIASTMLATPALAQSSDWPSVNNNLEATCFADQAEITPANVAMADILGYARVSTGQSMRLEAGAIRAFTDVMSGKSMERPG